LQSAFIPAVKSILASNDEDEKKRRRKSLARRRVSFAPEATLHTWDVVEYVRDATTSSASSEGSRRASAASENAQPDQPTVGFADSHESPSTPPPNADEPQDEPSSSPANQRDLHQKKHRRSSGIPPMNFNNPDDIYSSSPLSGDDAQTPAHTEAPGLQLDGHDDENDEDDDVSMEIAEDEITTSFKPWAKTFTLDTTDDQEKRDPFSAATPPGASDAQDDNEDVSMDITRAIGAIVQQSESPASDLEDISMDLTLPLGNIKAVNPQAQANRRKSLKRRASLFETSQGSPAKRPAGRRTSLRKRAAEEKEEEVEDATMDFTVAIGSIKSGATMERQQVPSRRQSVETSFADETMEFTVAIGSIKDQGVSEQTQHSDPVDDEDMSMEFTRVVGGIKNLNKVMGASETAALTKDSSPATTKPPTPRKSPARVRASSSTAATGSRSPPKMDRSTPRKSPGRPHGVLLATPIIPPPSEQIEKFEPSPFVRHAPQALSQPEETISTPTRKPLQALPAETSEDPIAAPILNRRRSSLSSVQFSPLAPPREEPVFKSTASLSDNIKLLSTPRKQTLMSPMKRGLTPKKSQTPQQSTTPRRQTPTPKKDTPRKSLSPIKRVAFGEETPVQYDEKPEADEGLRDEVERISLQEFLDMTRIRFMDLSTTKRRHTAAPSSFHDKEVEEKEDSLDRYVVAAACTLPEYELYQHACHEMKKYISDGRHFVRTMEANVMEENPLLFTEYLTAPPDQRAVMDNQFKNLKTSARLDARGEWYTWRSTLLRDLKAGLLGTMDGFLRDELALAEKEKLLDSVLPPLVEQHEQLENQCKQLQQRHDELNSCDREELEQTREQLVAADAEMAEKRQLIAQLQSELSEKEARIEAAKERKVECAAEIKAAERVREECRGWSVSEVNDLKRKSLSAVHVELC
jgi:kinetochore protein Spc7/SPC105